MFEFRAAAVTIGMIWLARLDKEPGAWIWPILGAVLLACLESIYDGRADIWPSR